MLHTLPQPESQSNARARRDLSSCGFLLDFSDLGLKVRSDMPPEILQLMGLFPQPMRRQPSVEYVPLPRRAEPTPTKA